MYNKETNDTAHKCVYKVSHIRLDFPIASYSTVQSLIYIVSQHLSSEIHSENQQRVYDYLKSR